MQPLLEHDGLAFPAGREILFRVARRREGRDGRCHDQTRERSVGVQTCLRNEQRPCPGCHRPSLVTDVVWPPARRTELHVDLRVQHADDRHRRQTRNSGTESARSPVSCSAMKRILIVEPHDVTRGILEGAAALARTGRKPWQLRGRAHMPARRTLRLPGHQHPARRVQRSAPRLPEPAERAARRGRLSIAMNAMRGWHERFNVPGRFTRWATACR